MVMYEVADERRRQDQKWGTQDHSPMIWSAILGEEFGEACQQALGVYFSGWEDDELRKELVQVAAVAVAWIECIDREKFGVIS